MHTGNYNIYYNNVLNSCVSFRAELLFNSYIHIVGIRYINYLATSD